MYKDYLTYTKKLKDKTSELSEKRNEKKIGEQELKSEKNKSQYFHTIKDVYQYSNGICSLHKEYNKYENLVLEEELKDGIRNGTFKMYENGKVKEEGTYLNNKKNGLWTLYSYNGKEEITFSIDVKNGEYKKYNGDVVVSQGRYSNGLMIGEWIYRWDNGNLKGQGNYINGDGGNLSESGFPINGRDGLWKWNYENGEVKLTLNYNNGLLNGEFVRYHENGEVKEIGLTKDGKNEGEWKIFYDSGSIELVVSYVNGKEEGEEIKYHENGKIRYTVNYSNGKREGEYLGYYEDGSLKVKLTYKNGTEKFEGNRETDYEKDGSISGEFEFRNGKWEKYLSPEEREEREKYFKSKEFIDEAFKTFIYWDDGIIDQQGDLDNRYVYIKFPTSAYYTDYRVKHKEGGYKYKGINGEEVVTPPRKDIYFFYMSQNGRGNFVPGYAVISYNMEKGSFYSPEMDDKLSREFR